MKVTEHIPKAGELSADLDEIRKELQLEKLRRKATEVKLNKLHRIHASMAHNFPGGVIGVLNRDMHYVLIEGQEVEEKSHEPLGVIGQRIFASRDPKTVEETLSNLKKAFDGENVNFEIATGDEVYNLMAVPLADDKNEITEILCILQNVTERKKMENGLIHALEQEKELGELKSRFVTMASHEFRTPLTTILSSTFLLENFSTEAYAKEKGTHINRIKRAVKNLTMILNEFLSLEKLEEKRVQIVYSEVNVPEFVQDLIGEIEAARKEGQTIRYNHLGSQTIAMLDHHLLWSIVSNLLSNSIKYSKPGSEVIITTELGSNLLKLKVEDAGIGIPADEQKYIFSRFYRARNAINYEGTGLGLHIVQKYVNLVKGTINFESELDEGTIFTVVLPLERTNDKLNDLHSKIS